MTEAAQKILNEFLGIKPKEEKKGPPPAGVGNNLRGGVDLQEPSVGITPGAHSKQNAEMFDTGKREAINALANWYEEFNKNPAMHYNKNLARGTPDTNITGMGWKQAMQHQRMADMLNNRVYRNVSQAGQWTRSGPKDAQIGSLYQMPKIETLGTRQVDQMFDRAAQDDARKIMRQNNYLDQQERMTAALQAEHMRQLQLIDDETYKQLVQYSFDEGARRKAAEFDQMLALDTAHMKFNNVQNIIKNGGPMGIMIGAMLSDIYGQGITIPSWDQMIWFPKLQELNNRLGKGEPLSSIGTGMFTELLDFAKEMGETVKVGAEQIVAN